MGRPLEVAGGAPMKRPFNKLLRPAELLQYWREFNALMEKWDTATAQGNERRAEEAAAEMSRHDLKWHQIAAARDEAVPA